MMDRDAASCLCEIDKEVKARNIQYVRGGEWERILQLLCHHNYLEIMFCCIVKELAAVRG